MFELLWITEACLCGHNPSLTPCFYQSRRWRSNSLQLFQSAASSLPSSYPLISDKDSVLVLISNAAVLRCGLRWAPHCCGSWWSRWRGWFCWYGPECLRWWSVWNELCRFPLERWPKSPDHLVPDAELPINSEWQQTGFSGMQNNLGFWMGEKDEGQTWINSTASKLQLQQQKKKTKQGLSAKREQGQISLLNI